MTENDVVKSKMDFRKLLMEENRRTRAFSYKIQKFLLSFQRHGLIINVLFDWAMSFQLCDDP